MRLRVKDSSHEECEEVYVSCLTALYISYLIIRLSGLRMWCSARWLHSFRVWAAARHSPPPNCFYAPWRAFNLHSFRRLVLTWHGDNENSHVQRCQSVYGNRHWPLRAHSFSVKFSQRAARWRISVYALRLDWRNVDVFSPSVGIKSSEPK